MSRKILIQVDHVYYPSRDVAIDKIGASYADDGSRCQLVDLPSKSQWKHTGYGKSAANGSPCSLYEAWL